MLEVLDGNSGFSAVFGSYDDAPRHPSAVSQYRNLLHHYVHNRNAGETATFWAGCGAVKKEVFHRAGKFDEKRYLRPQIEDIELGYRLRAAGARILIDPRIQCSHHKSWDTVSMVRTDLRDRAVPWVKLLLSSPEKRSSPSPSLGSREVFGTAAIGGAVIFGVLALTRYSTVAIIGLAVCIALSIWINRDLYRWFIEKRGAGFATKAVPLHFLYQLVSGVAVPIGVASYVSESWLPRSRADAEGSVSFNRFAPLASGEILSRVIALVATAYLARVLGATGFGQIAFAAAVVAQFGTALAAGIGEVGAREIARAPARIRQIAAGGALARLLGSIVAISFVLALTLILPLDRGTKQVTALSALLLIPLALDTGWVYKGAGKTQRIGWALLIDQGVSLVLIVLFIRDATKVTTVPVLQALGDMIASVFLAIPLLRGRWRVPDRAAVAELPRQSGLITVSRSLRTIIISFDIILLGLMVKSADVGLYSAAYRIVFFVMAIVYASHVAFLPEMSRSGADTGRMSSILSRAVGLSVTVALPFVVGGWMVAPSLMSLIFGEAYRGGAVALQLLLVSILFIAIHGTTRNVFLARERLGTETAIVGIGVVTNIVLNLILIPRSGITGAAVATVIGEGVILVFALGAVLVMGLRPTLSQLLPPLIAAAGLVLAMTWFGLEQPLPAVIAVGAVSYVVILFAVQSLFRKGASSTFAEAGA
jgi:O-antigen/teichoic acid export membrane protein